MGPLPPSVHSSYGMLPPPTGGLHRLLFASEYTSSVPESLDSSHRIIELCSQTGAPLPPNIPQQAFQGFPSTFPPPFPSPHGPHPEQEFTPYQHASQASHQFGQPTPPVSSGESLTATFRPINNIPDTRSPYQPQHGSQSQPPHITPSFQDLPVQQFGGPYSASFTVPQLGDFGQQQHEQGLNIYMPPDGSQSGNEPGLGPGYNANTSHERRGPDDGSGYGE